MLNLPRFRSRLIGASLALLGASTALADIDPNSGIDFVRIGATYGGAGNPAWPGTNPQTPGDRAVGRGSVNYEYNIGKFEVTTAQWVEFFNAAYDRPASDRIPFVAAPQSWGAVSATPNTSGGVRWRVPAGNEMLPVGNISWRTAAIYCNWLCNNKSTDRSAFLNGAYDVSTFGWSFPGSNVFTDQATHNPGARYWIPTWDEWLKAAHFDPNKTNQDGSHGGWWQYSTTSDTAPISNPPSSLVPGSNGQINAGGWTIGGLNPGVIPLGAYANVTSPWGLYDTAGGTAEWTEEVISAPGGVLYRQYNGSWLLDGPVIADHIGVWSSDFPNVSTFDHGFRIASAIPSAGSVQLIVFAGAWSAFGRRRRFPRDTIPASNPPVHVGGL